MPRTKRIPSATDAETLPLSDAVPPKPQNGNGNGDRHAKLSEDVSDLADLFQNETAVITIYDPRDWETKETKPRDTGFRVEIGPLWSPEAKAVADERRDELKKLPDGSLDTDDPKFDETIFEQLIAVTKRWWKVGSGELPDGIKLHGEFLACTRENVRKVYENPKLTAFFEQVRAGYLDRSRFFGPPRPTV